MLSILKKLFTQKKWKKSPRMLGGATARPWTKGVTLNSSRSFGHAKFGKYDRPGFGRVLLKWAILVPVAGAIVWFIWESLPGATLFQ